MKTIDILAYILLFIAIGACLYVYFDGDTLQLKCIVSTVDGHKYCVRDRDQVQAAADLLAKTTSNCQRLVDYMGEKHPEKEHVNRLVKGFKPNRIMETLPTSSYTAYSENKGRKIAFCLNKKKKENNNMIDEHTLFFVAMHELSHIMTKSIGHKQEFWDNFKFLLQNAKDCGIHDPEDYSKNPKEYCGMTINDNPYYT